MIFMFAEIKFCPTVNLEQPLTVLILFLTCQLSCGRDALPDFIRTTTEFTGFKRESSAAFGTAAFLYTKYIFK